MSAPADLERRIWNAEIRTQHLAERAEATRQSLAATLQELAQLWTIEGVAPAGGQCLITLTGKLVGCYNAFGDQGYAPIPGASLSVIGQGTGTNYGSTTTAADGTFTIPISVPKSSSDYAPSGVHVVCTAATGYIVPFGFAIFPVGNCDTTVVIATQNVGGVLIWNALFGPLAGFVCTPCGSIATSTTFTLTDSVYGPVTLTWNAGVGAWTASTLVNYAVTCQGCPPRGGVQVIYTLPPNFLLSLQYMQFGLCPAGGAPQSLAALGGITRTALSCHPTALAFTITPNRLYCAGATFTVS